MKVLFFTPGLDASAISRVTRLVVESLLAGGHSAEVVRCEQEALLGKPSQDFGCPTLAWTDAGAVDSALARCDGIVYQIGNNFEYHEGCLHWLQLRPGVVCLHDFFLGHLFGTWASGNPAEALRIATLFHGHKLATRFFESLATSDFIAKTHDTMPMTEWISSMASGAVTHSMWGIKRVFASCPGPVRVVPLPYAAPVAHSPAAKQPPASGRRLKVLTVGHVNPNKRAESVISAIGSSELLRSVATYTLVGAAQPERAGHLKRIASKMGVQLDLKGEVDSGMLATALAEADIVCCLRWPTLEAASASAIEAMLCDKPVIVEDAGFYSELPDQCVRKIRPTHEVEDLRRVLEEFCRDARAREELGARAGLWARETFSAANYAEELVAILADCGRSMPIFETMQSMMGQLREWGGSERLMMLPQTIEPLRIFESE
jgi:glycosyltransferase involved in cell wall biosynthesis